MKLVLWTTASIVRFWGRMTCKAGQAFLRCMWFALLDFEIGQRLGGLTTKEGQGAEPAGLAESGIELHSMGV